MLNYIKSPLNYTGGKFKLLDQIIPLFPKEIDTFIDLFTGGCNVAINVESNKIIANDINKHIIELYNYFKVNSFNNILNDINKIISYYELSESSKYGYKYYNSNANKGVSIYNKEKHIKLRSDYNLNPNPLMFFILIVFSFNNQINFNKKGEFNSPVNKRDFNSVVQFNLEAFINKIQTLDIKFYSKNYNEININKNDFVYIDPPYLISDTSYNKANKWDINKEKELLNFLNCLNSNETKFALSNVFENKGFHNEILIEWSKNYNVYFLNKHYNNCNYQTKNRINTNTIEVLITNY